MRGNLTLLKLYAECCWKACGWLSGFGADLGCAQLIRVFTPLQTELLKKATLQRGFFIGY